MENYNIVWNEKIIYDDEIGIIKNYSLCTNDNFMLSDIHNLNKISKLEYKNNNYYLFDKLFLSKKEFNEYSNLLFDEMKNKISKDKLYYTIDHIGDYNTINESYIKLLKKIKNDNAKINGIPMEIFIDGRWNKNNTDEYLTKIMIPIKK